MDAWRWRAEGQSDVTSTVVPAQGRADPVTVAVLEQSVTNGATAAGAAARADSRDLGVVLVAVHWVVLEAVVVMISWDPAASSKVDHRAVVHSGVPPEVEEHPVVALTAVFPHDKDALVASSNDYLKSIHHFVEWLVDCFIQSPMIR